MKQYKLIKKPEDGYYKEEYSDYVYTSKDWRIGMKAVEIPENQEWDNIAYYVQTGQCEPFLTKEQVEERPDLWEELSNQ